MRFMLTCSADVSADSLIPLLEAHGLQIDRRFSPLVVDRVSGCYVLRGEGSPDALKKAREELGVEVFPDQRLGSI